MVKNKNADLTKRLSEVVVYGMQEKKAHEVVRLDLREIHSSLADFFVICHADSHIQVAAIAKSVEDEVYKALGIWPHHVEGQQNGEWILLDYFDLMVHIFKKDNRTLFAIEELWGDAEKVAYEAPVTI
ncbi:ribosome silencing factor [Sphingobacteriaceae bacterium WQ 2009]|uniref:Ribosomal silencing factor RsfS n=1 Tax=Rhinopithecimicrobium faecis TaxID=2820698 RepID=A0A8T4HFF9_9SPHI|nr:ribosome silencing factor [Sphingobacteriaceae bacterium WQ 2009]